MDLFKENILRLLCETKYDLRINADNLKFTESPFTSWFNQNISKENCITEEELIEFEALEENGEALYGEELDKALEEYHDAHAIGLIPVNECSEDIKKDELEHAEHQVEVKKQLASALESTSYSLENNYCDVQEQFQNVDAEQICVLKNLADANNQFNIELRRVKDAQNTLVEEITELSKEPSAEEGMDTFSSDKLKSSDISNSSFLSTVSTLSTNKVMNSKYMFQIPLNKYSRQHTSFSRHLKNALLRDLSKKPFEGSRGSHDHLLAHNIMHRLFRQKMMISKLTAELECITAARNTVQEKLGEIKTQTWKPTQAILRTEMAVFEHSSILNVSEASLMDNENELNEVCKKWADLQLLKPIHDGLQENTAWDQTMMTKLDELVSIMNVKLALDVQLYELMQCEHDLVNNIMDLYNEMHTVTSDTLEATRTRMAVMAENVQDYNNHCAISNGAGAGDLLDCLAVALGCHRTAVPEAYSQLTTQINNNHQQLVHNFTEHLNTFASIHKDLKDFHLEEEERLSYTQMPSNQEYCDSLKDTLEVIFENIEGVKILIQTLQDTD